MKILLASPRGFCAGVEMAIESLELALEAFPAPIYVYHEIVHNKFVVEQFEKSGAIFVTDLEPVPPGSTLLFSAHGVSPEIRSQAQDRKLQAIDATCPLVTKVHLEAIKYAKEGRTIILIGHNGHDEVIGTMGEAPDEIVLVETPEDVDRLEVRDPNHIAYLTQTTLSVDDANRVICRLQERFPNIVAPPKDDICYATQNRQQAVRRLAAEADFVLVVGSQNSSNSQRLADIGQECGKPSRLIDGVDDLDETWFEESQTVLVTAGASAPESLVQDVCSYLIKRFDAKIDLCEIRKEQVTFPLPRELRSVAT